LLARIGPTTRHKGPVPAHYGLRAHEESGPALLREHARSGGKQRAVVRPEIWPLRLTAEDADLVAENQNLDLLSFFGAQRHRHEFEKATQRPVAKRKMRFRLHERRRLRHLTSWVAVADSVT
jgi:hypothetical protein